LAPRPCAISSDPDMSPAMLVWIPMRVLPSFQAGISGGGGASGRYSSAASKVKVILSVCSAIPSRVQEPYPPSQEGRPCGSRTRSESPIIPTCEHRRKTSFTLAQFTLALLSAINPWDHAEVEMGKFGDVVILGVLSLLGVILLMRARSLSVYHIARNAEIRERHPNFYRRPTQAWRRENTRKLELILRAVGVALLLISVSFLFKILSKN
jgi:hypothetical protein